MKVCSVNLHTGKTINNCGSATCSLCLNRKRKTRNRKLIKAFSTLKERGNKLLALTIEPSGSPTSDREEIIYQIKKWVPIKRALVRKFKPQGYYFQAEFDHKLGYSGLLPHCHGIMA